MSIHYALRPEVDKTTFLGGILAAGDTDIDVLADLQAGGGVITIADDDHLKAAVLDGYTPLQRVLAPSGETPAAEPEAPEPVLASDGEPIEIPDGVIPGETPGWPIDAVTDRPLRLTDEEREELATRPLEDAPNSGTTPSRSASRNARKES